MIAAWLEEARRYRWQTLTLTTEDVGYSVGTWTICFELQVASGDLRVTLKLSPPLEVPDADHLDILTRCLAQLEPMPSVRTRKEASLSAPSAHDDSDRDLGLIWVVRDEVQQVFTRARSRVHPKQRCLCWREADGRVVGRDQRRCDRRCA